VAWTVWLDFARRKDFFVILFLIGIFALGALAARAIGIDSDSEARFLLSSGLGLAGALAALLTTIFAARSMPEEYDNRTLYPMLAKPLKRSDILWGKFCGVFSIGACSFLVFLLLAWLPVPKTSDQHWALLVQAAGLRIAALAALAWLALWLSVWLPAALTVVISLSVFFAGGPLASLVVRMAGDHRSAGILADMISRIVPDFSALDFLQGYVNGAPAMGWSLFGALILYILFFAVLFACLATIQFERRAL
jgi:ABC-type transport system involved in multi-copper enzyme maturation permease subunit